MHTQFKIHYVYYDDWFSFRDVCSQLSTEIVCMYVYIAKYSYKYVTATSNDLRANGDASDVTIHVI